MTVRRFIYTQGGVPLPEPIEVTDEWRQPDSGPKCTSEEEIYGRLQATDGTDISSRTKRERYMRANGLADAGDFKETWSKAQKDREAYRRGEKVNPERREALGRIAYQMEQKRRRR